MGPAGPGSPAGGGTSGRVPRIRPISATERRKSRPPPIPADFIARAIAVSRAIPAAACTPGSRVAASVAVPSGSGYKLTFACRCASRRRCSAPSGSAAITARRSATRSCPLVCPPAFGSTADSTARAVSSSSGPVASAISLARYRSMVPADSAARVAASRHRSVTPRLVQAIAAGWDITSSRPTVDAAAGVTRSGRPSAVDADVVIAGGDARRHLRDRG